MKFKGRINVLAQLACGLGATTVVSAEVLWDNGPFVTTRGGGFAGADVSEVQTMIGGATTGYGCALFHGQSIADDFTLNRRAVIQSITCFAYQTNSSTTSTMTGLYLRIWSGRPGEPGSVIVWGDAGLFLETDLLSETNWTGAYRASDVNPLSAARPIMRLIATPTIELDAGTYWMEWGAAGSFTLTGPLTIPVTVADTPGQGNARRFNPKSFQWEDAIDGGAIGWHDDFPFILEGEEQAEPADMNGDGVVDGIDLGILLGNWSIPAGSPGCEGAVPCAADLNADGVVDGIDLGILLANWTM